MAEFAVHFGAKQSDIPALTEVFRPAIVFVDGDGWNCWGDKPGADVNDADTYHVVIKAPIFHDALVVRSLVLARKDLLVPMGGHRTQEGILVIVSDWDDWADQYENATVKA